MPFPLRAGGGRREHDTIDSHAGPPQENAKAKAGRTPTPAARSYYTRVDWCGKKRQPSGSNTAISLLIEHCAFKSQGAWDTLRRKPRPCVRRISRFSIETSTGTPAETIAEVAANRPHVLIAMATHGYRGLRRLAAGSVADTVVHTTTTPIFLVHDGAALSGHSWTLRRILVPLDGSALAQQALPLARTLAMRAPAELVLLRARRTQ
jgi:nucleotide-binding universal stress UspA family protein